MAKTLTSAAAGPFYPGRVGAPPPVALDVFSVQVGATCVTTFLQQRAAA